MSQQKAAAMQIAERVARFQRQLEGLADFPLLEAPPVRLRGPREEDTDRLFALFSDPAVMRYWSRGPMTERAEAAGYIANIHEGFASRSLINWAIVDPGTDRLVGTCTLYDLQPRHLRVALGYALMPACQGRGIARSAARLALDWAFAELGAHRAEADVDPRNAPSIRLLESLGFRHEGLLRERFVADAEIQDSMLYGVLASEWAGARAT